MSREEAAAKYANREDAAAYALAASDVRFPDIRAIHALEAADAYDDANGVHRVSLDEGTVERAARALALADGFTELDWAMVPSRYTKRFYEQARAALAAAVKEDG